MANENEADKEEFKSVQEVSFNYEFVFVCATFVLGQELKALKKKIAKMEEQEEKFKVILSKLRKSDSAREQQLKRTDPSTC